MMTALRIRTTAAGEEAAAVDAIVLGFASDPVARWCWPDPHRYLASMPGFTRAFAGVAFAHDSAYCTEDFVGAALWVPPGVHGDADTLDRIMQATLTETVLNDLGAAFERLDACHPQEPHWYLPMIAVDPAYQNKGYGAALMAHALERCDRDHLPAYLESTNPKNISLYRRHGFEAVAEVQVGSSPVFVPMVRRAR